MFIIAHFGFKGGGQFTPCLTDLRHVRNPAPDHLLSFLSPDCMEELPASACVSRESGGGGGMTAPPPGEADRPRLGISLLHVGRLRARASMEVSVRASRE